MDHTIFFPPTTREPVARPIMRQGWRDLTFVHWSYDPAVVQRRLPPGLAVDTFEGRAWVGLVAFHMQRIRVPGLPAVPYFGTFPETNVRTYVRGPDGTPGVWFDSLDVTRLLPVLVARASYRLPYMWSNMAMSRRDTEVAYSTRRRWPDPRGATSVLIVEPGAEIARLSPLECFLTARWRLFTKLQSRLAYAPVDHPAWPLQAADIVHLDDELVEAAGYPPPDGTPVVHYSPGVEVRVGLPRTVTR